MTNLKYSAHGYSALITKKHWVTEAPPQRILTTINADLKFSNLEWLYMYVIRVVLSSTPVIYFEFEVFTNVKGKVSVEIFLSNFYILKDISTCFLLLYLGIECSTRSDSGKALTQFEGLPPVLDVRLFPGLHSVEVAVMAFPFDEGVYQIYNIKICQASGDSCFTEMTLRRTMFTVPHSAMTFQICL